MAWMVHDYPEPRFDQRLYCPLCGSGIQDKAYYIDGDYICYECAESKIQESFTFDEIIERLGIEIVSVEEIT